MATIQKIGKRWRVRIRRQGFPAVSEMFDTKARAQEWATKTVSDMQSLKYQDGRIIADKTLGPLIDDYIEEFSKIRPFGKSKVAVLNSLKLSLGDVLLPYLHGDRLIEYVKMRRTPVDGYPAAGGVTISIDLTYLAGVLRAAKEVWRLPVDMEAIPQARNYMRHIGLSTKSQERTRRPTALEITNLCTYFQAKPRQRVPMWDRIPFAIGTAMRTSEILRLKWEDPDEPRIFPITEGTISSIFPRACQALKIKDLTFHDFRHEGVSRLFEQGYGIEQVALVSGRKDWKMLARYTQIRAKNLHRDEPPDPAAPNTPQD